MPAQDQTHQPSPVDIGPLGETLGVPRHGKGRAAATAPTNDTTEQGHSMFRSHFTRMAGIGIAAILMRLGDALASAVSYIVGSLMSLRTMGAEIIMGALKGIPAPMAPPGYTTRPNAHPATNNAKRSPTIEPGWRMCGST